MFTRQAHEHTMGYITKHQKVVANVGYEQSEITQFFQQSDDYRRQHETERKRDYRTRKMELEEVMEIVYKDFDTGAQRISSNPEKPVAFDIISHFLQVCESNEVRFPTRSQMETYVNQILFKLNYKYSVVEYYSRAYR